MLSWESPLWLLALIVLPLLRLLHWINNRKAAIPVSSLLFWRTSGAVSQPFWQGAKVDPIWLLRAMIFGAMILALAGPVWVNHDQRKVRVWFDDSYSLQTTESASNQSRLALAIDALINKLQEVESIQAKVYSLRNPGYMPLLLDTQNKSDWRQQLSNWVTSQSESESPPLAGQPMVNVETWLVTDGADPELTQAIKALPIHQIIRVGNETENGAVTLLGARPSLQKFDIWQGIIRVNHFGDSGSNRTIELWYGNQMREQWQVRMVPEQSREVGFTVEYAQTNPAPLMVRLTPTDSLQEDDQLSLSFPLPTSTRIHGNCPATLMAAINVHPFLRTDGVNDEQAGLDIVCGDIAVEGAGAILRFHQADGVQKIDTAPVWSEFAGALGDLRLPPHLMRQVRSSADNRHGTAVLLSDSIPLITLATATHSVVDCYIDMGYEEFARQAEYPVLFAGLVDLATGRSHLSPIAVIARKVEASRVKPLPLSLADANPEDVLQTASRDLAAYLIFLAMLLLLVDAVLERTRRTESRQP
ncbi:MAG: BatA domain-containing protein [Methylomonas sp.]|jgi:hypothetical protein|uniref:BatA domain-containing protein n=1 Tax=Methylomonas sp. TaxID=418 RepID=UPI0025EE5563|nr:BatA domain-containing protein [Methylomonas sp.]MCK9607050.1 BatA domain-containing protein [Methylomonas sp.]